jgi:hypothetical protein
MLEAKAEEIIVIKATPDKEFFTNHFFLATNKA